MFFIPVLRGGLNRTILELKRYQVCLPLYHAVESQSHHIGIETTYHRLGVAIEDGLNRTILELKLDNESYQRSLRNSLNRTILELKLARAASMAWAAGGSQSHHIGIETHATQPWAVGQRGLNRTILELKHRPDALSLPASYVSIAPYWN